MNIQTYQEAMNWLICSLAFNSILLFCLFAPNIVYLIHKRHFNWVDESITKKELIEILTDLDDAYIGELFSTDLTEMSQKESIEQFISNYFNKFKAKQNQKNYASKRFTQRHL